MDWGFSFSRRQAEWLGLNWQETFRRLGELGFSHVRLSVYWDEVETEPDHYDFSKISEELELAEKLGLKVMLTVGMKAQRWPEFFIPHYVLNRKDFSGEIAHNSYAGKRVMLFLSVTINTLKHYKSIESWQIENEPLDIQHPRQRVYLKLVLFFRRFLRFVRIPKQKPNVITMKLLQKELKLAKRLDPGRPTSINFWGNDFNKRGHLYKVFKLKNVDMIGFDFYPRQYESGLNGFRGPDLEPRDIAEINRQFKEVGLTPTLTELQAEPWEAFPFKELRQEITSISPGLIKQNIAKYKDIGFDRIYLWGAEYWIWAGIEKEVATMIK